VKRIESIYRSVSSFEPLLPESKRPVLAELSVEIFKKSGELKSALPSRVMRDEMAKLVRGMNSYYSNLIEGHKTLPKEIERALKEEFSGREEDQRNQKLSVAHIRAESKMREALLSMDDGEIPTRNVYSPEFICWLHGLFYSGIPREDWFTTSTSGKRFDLKPGVLRDHNVEVGGHTPPDAPALLDFLRRYDAFYSSERIAATDRLIAMAAAHHRLAWIHPFGDGNGRVARLQSQAAMIAMGVDGNGLWTLSRGLARERPKYYRLLQEADRGRQNDFDGRGNLSDRALAEFCVFFLERVLDQMDFMLGLIAPLTLVQRVERYLAYERMDLDGRLREHLGKLLKALCLEGELKRGDVAGILGLKGTASRDVIRHALKDGLVTSVSEKGPLRIGFPDKVVEFYFPRLFTDLPVSAE
jgi:Fic family protein